MCTVITHAIHSKNSVAVALTPHKSRLNYRAYNYVKSSRGILVFHAFVKKTQETPTREIEIARNRLREMLNDEKKVNTLYC